MGLGNIALSLKFPPTHQPQFTSEMWVKFVGNQPIEIRTEHAIQVGQLLGLPTGPLLMHSSVA